MNRFWDEYPVIQKDLENVVDIMKKQVKCSEKHMEEALLDLIGSGGKLLRPAFMLISAGFGKKNSQKLYSLAAVIEMFHMATLVHDDIVDDSIYRRGQKTIQSKYGKDTAVFMGDFLFSRCFTSLSEKTSMTNMRLLSQVIGKICVGEIEQNSSKHKINTSTKRYLKRIGAKTAALFAMSFLIGARESKCSQKLSKNLANVGYYTGMAFQIIDDILDFSGEEKVVGKSLGNDLKEGLFTLPVIYGIQAKDEELLALLSKGELAEAEVRQIISRCEKLGYIEKARAVAHRYTEKAFIEISRLPDNPNKEILNSLVSRLISRDY